MHYPWWYVPHLTAPMLIAAISVIHILVSHYAVGGGIFLATEVTYARRKNDAAYLDYLKRHAAFFVLLTVSFGAITGVGIWWTIGLASPLATETLIRLFVFGWATEWVFFVVEVVSAFIFYYYWDRLPKKTHVIFGWIYAVAAWISLVLITGITAFMLNPGDWPNNRNFWTAFFNPQFLPQTIARTGGAILLSSLYVYLHASLTLKDDKNGRLRDLIASRSTRPGFLGAAMIVVGGAGWLVFLPESAQATLASAAVLNVFMGLILAMIAVLFAMLYIGPYKNPSWLSPGFAAALCLFGIGAFSVGEFIREAVRKPFVVYNVVLSNQILPENVQDYRAAGYLQSGLWTNAYMKQNFPQVFVGDKISSSKLLTLSAEDRIRVGETMFQYHCNDCHASLQGYSAACEMLRGRPREMVLDMVKHLEKAQIFMPAWAGTNEEAEVLTDYLIYTAPKKPEGMRLGLDNAEVK